MNNEGLVRASLIVEHEGEIYSTASGGDIVNSGILDVSVISGSEAPGGDVVVHSDRDITLVPAVINARWPVMVARLLLRKCWISKSQR